MNSSAGHSSLLCRAVGALVVGGQHDVEVGAAEAERADRRRSAPPPAPAHGRAAAWNTNGLVSASHAGFGCVRCSVGGLTPVCRASAALISPARPAAHLVCPICDFTEPSAQVARLRRPASVNTSVSVASSVRSPTTVPVPCASTSPTCGRRHPGVAVGAGPARCAGPPAAARSGRAPGRRWRADALDHRVDPVAVALGVGQPLEHDAGDALAERDAVGGCVERRRSGRSATARATEANSR